MHPIVEEIGKSKVEYTVHLKANFDAKLHGTDVVVRIPTPPNTTGVKCEVALGKAKWDSSSSQIVWKMPRIQGMSDATLTAEATLTSTTTVRKAWSRPPIEMDFEVLMLTASGLLVRYLKVWEKSGYQSIKWVRYVSRAGGGTGSSYAIRI